MRDSMMATFALIDIANALRDLSDPAFGRVFDKRMEAEVERLELLQQVSRALDLLASTDGTGFRVTRIGALVQLWLVILPISGAAGELSLVADRTNKLIGQELDELLIEDPPLAKVIRGVLTGKEVER